MKKRLLNVLLLTTLSLSSWALEQDVEGYYLLGSADDWKAFAQLVKTNGAVNAKMTADIDLGEEVVMVGSYSSMYSGIFDGQGHTLTIKFNTAGLEREHSYLGCAPFYDIYGATIRNLHTAGSITVDQVGAAGLIGWAYGENTVECCWSSVDIIGTNSTADTFSGFVFRQDGSSFTYNDCVYTGKIESIKKVAHAGFTGHQVYGTTTINNSLFILGEGSDEDEHNSFYTFVRNWYYYTPVVTNNSYYLRPWGEVQGTATTAEEMANGTTATKLQNGREAEVWVQKDGAPMLKVFAGGGTGIEHISRQATGHSAAKQWYSLDSKRMNSPQKGFNIVHLADGTTRKVVIR